MPQTYINRTNGQVYGGHLYCNLIYWCAAAAKNIDLPCKLDFFFVIIPKLSKIFTQI
jgi:hypothetical protein